MPEGFNCRPPATKDDAEDTVDEVSEEEQLRLDLHENLEKVEGLVRAKAQALVDETKGYEENEDLINQLHSALEDIERQCQIDMNSVMNEFIALGSADIAQFQQRINAVKERVCQEMSLTALKLDRRKPWYNEGGLDIDLAVIEHEKIINQALSEVDETYDYVRDALDGVLPEDEHNDEGGAEVTDEEEWPESEAEVKPESKRKGIFSYLKSRSVKEMVKDAVTGLKKLPGVVKEAAKDKRKEAFETAEAEISSLKGKNQKLKERLEVIEARVASITKARLGLSPRQGGSSSRKKRKIIDINLDIGQIKAKIEKNEKAIQEKREEVKEAQFNDLETQKESAQESIQEKKADIDALVEKIQGLKDAGATESTLLGFFEERQRLVDSIQKESSTMHEKLVDPVSGKKGVKKEKIQKHAEKKRSIKEEEEQRKRDSEEQIEKENHDNFEIRISENFDKMWESHSDLSSLTGTQVLSKLFFGDDRGTQVMDRLVKNISGLSKVIDKINKKGEGLPDDDPDKYFDDKEKSKTELIHFFVDAGVDLGELIAAITALDGNKK